MKVNRKGYGFYGEIDLEVINEVANNNFKCIMLKIIEPNGNLKTYKINFFDFVKFYETQVKQNRNITECKKCGRDVIMRF